MARLEAALIRAGFATHDKVTVRIGSEDAESVKKAFEACCISAEARSEAGSNAKDLVELAGLYGDPDRMTHVVASADVVDVPNVVLDVLNQLKATLPQKGRGLDPAETGWKLCADRSSSAASGILLHITTTRAKTTRFRLEAYAGAFSKELGVPVRLDYGQHPFQSDGWAQKRHAWTSTGISIGIIEAGATVTMPLRYLDDDKDKKAKSASPTRYPFLSSAHPFIGRGKIGLGGTVYQPSRDTNADRAVGIVTDCEYDEQYNAINFFDAAILESTLPPTPSFTKEARALAGIWEQPLTEKDKTFICGAVTGLRAVRVEYYYDVSLTVLTTGGTRVIYKDLIEFSHDEGSWKPASMPGDSGAALLVRDKDKFYVAGLVVAGGVQTAKSRHPRSYAIPIRRILRRFNVEPN